jgi:ligand-binding sensor domain-containing protein
MKAVGRTGGLAVGIVAGALLTARPPTRLPAQSLWGPDERVLIADFSYVQAIAASASLVFAATTHGLTIYDRVARAWQAPITALDGYPAAPVRVALGDLVGNAVWLGTDRGWAHYDADIRRWDEGYTAGGVSSFMLDAGDPASGVYVRSGTGWGFLPRGGLSPVAGQPLPPPNRRIVPLTPEAALQLAPMADALRAFMLTDARLRSVRFTCATRTPDRADLFFGTSGMGVVRFDPTTTEREPLPFGLLAPRAGAVATGTGGVWVASQSRAGERRGVTWVAADLAADSVIEGAGVIGFGCVEGRRLLASGSFLWLACERGLLKIEVGSDRSRLLDASVLSLAPAPDGVWVGTPHGLARVTPDDRVLTIGTLAYPVLSLLAVRDSLWVGTTAGLGLLLPGGSEVDVPSDIGDQPALRAPILALAGVGDTLVAVTPDQFAWRDPATHGWTLVHARSDLGAINALAGDAAGHGVWIAGTTALAFWDLAHDSFHILRAPYDVPAVVHDVAVDSRYVWVATDSGLVRFTRSAALGR